MQHDLLMDTAHLVYAVDCQEQDDTLHCGALFLEPRIPFKSMRLSDDSGSIDVSLQDELLHQEEPLRLWDIQLALAKP